METLLKLIKFSHANKIFLCKSVEARQNLGRVYEKSVCCRQRIINDRMEKYLPTSYSSQSSIAAMKNFLAGGRLTPLSSPPPPPAYTLWHTLWHTLRPPLFPMSGRAWGMRAVGGCARAITVRPTLLLW